MPKKITIINNTRYDFRFMLEYYKDQLDKISKTKNMDSIIFIEGNRETFMEVYTKGKLVYKTKNVTVKIAPIEDVVRDTVEIFKLFKRG